MKKNSIAARLERIERAVARLKTTLTPTLSGQREKGAERKRPSIGRQK